jgi:glycosyltransferase involved in cell wall biosynthesis
VTIASVIPNPAVDGSVVEASSADPSADGPIEVSVVIPCLNEAETLGLCIERAQRAMRDAAIRGEVVVADNGSTDGSDRIATSLGARVVPVALRGYGHALMAGIEAARGRYIVMGDADGSYDFLEVPRFVTMLRQGYDLVQGCRLAAGGGRVMPRAMPFLHQWWGNPMFSWMARSWFGAPIHDVYCGLRGFTKALTRRLDQRCTGMEFAIEMIVRATMERARIAEVPVTLYPDGRTAHAPHLKTFRDGWRSLRFFLLYCPRWLFLVPGAALFGFGVLGYGIALPQLRVGGIRFDVHTLLFASLSILCGYQAVLFAVFTKTFAIGEGLLPMDPRAERIFAHLTLEKGLVVAAAGMVAGLALLVGALAQWKARHFGDLDYVHTLRWVIPGVTLTALGFQTLLSSFFLSILGLRRR